MSEALAATNASDPYSLIRETLSVQVRHYDHPLMTSLNELLANPQPILGVNEGVVAVQASLASLNSATVQQARSQFKASIETTYPPSPTELSQPTANSSPSQTGSVALMDRPRVADPETLIATSKQELLRAIDTDDTAKAGMPNIDQQALREHVETVLSVNLRTIATEVEKISELLQPRSGRLGSFVLSKVGRGGVFHNFATGSGAANLHRSLNRLVQSLKLVAIPEVLADTVAGAVFAPSREAIKQQANARYTELLEVALAKLAEQLPAQEVSTLAVAAIGHASLGGSEVEDQTTAAELPSAGTPGLPASTSYRPPAYQKAGPAKGASEETERMPLEIEAIGVAKKVGGQGSVYRVEPIGVASSTESGDPAEAMIDGLVNTRDLKDWLRDHPDTTEDIRALMKLILQSPEVCKKLKRKISVWDPASPNSQKLDRRELSAREVKPAAGLKSPVTEQLRVFFFVVNADGQKRLVIYAAGNKSRFTGQFERHQ